MEIKTVTTHYNIIEWCFHEGGFHIGVAGYKLNVINHEMYPPLYSRRQKKTVKIGKWEIYTIKPCKQFKVDIKI